MAQKILTILISCLLLTSIGYTQSNYYDYNSSQKKNIFQDDFYNNSNKWSETNTTNTNHKMYSGYYKMESKSSSAYISTKSIYFNETKDFEIEARIKVASGVKTSGSGIIWGKENDGNNSFKFYYNPNGSYKIARYTGNYIALKNWTKLNSIGGYSYNTLTIRKVGDYYYFFINKELVHSTPFQSFYGNKLGFQVAKQTKLHVDYIKVSYLENEKDLVKIPILDDDFSYNDNGWAVNNKTESTLSIKNGYYYFKHKRSSKGWTSTINKYFNEYNNWEIITRIKKVSGVDNYGFGLIWGREDSDNMYYITLSGNGYYKIVKRKNGENYNIEDWEKTDIIKKWNGAYNTIHIKKINNKIKFYINNKLVKTATYQSFFGNRFGFVVYNNQEIAVDYLKINYLESENTQVVTVNDPPQITITKPVLARGFKVVPENSIRVEGQVYDSDGIRSVKINGLTANLVTNGYFSLDVPVKMGDNVITVTATDKKYKSSTRSFTITRKEEKKIEQKRIALVIGNAQYQHGGVLQNPVNDARAMKTTLESLGFKVMKYENCDQRTLKRAMDEFGEQLQYYDVGLFFYAGHGIQVNGENYLVPVEVILQNENDVEYDCVSTGRVLAKMENGGTGTNIVILDACRDNPFERSWGRSVKGNGLAFMNAPSGSLIAYATSPGTTASDGGGSNGLYTSALLRHIKTPDLTIEEVFKKVRNDVMKASKGKQTPWESTSMTGHFYFKQ